MQSIDQPTPALHTDTIDPLHDSPGRQLQVARETANLTLGQIASELHLSTSTIGALEDDHYDGLPSEVFVIGYLRAYARLLGLDPAPLLEQYRQLRPDTASSPQLSAEKHPENRNTSLVAPLLALVAVIMLGAAGWYGWTALGISEVLANLWSSSPAEDLNATPPVGRIPQPVLPRRSTDISLTPSGQMQGTNSDGASPESLAADAAMPVDEAQDPATEPPAQSAPDSDAPTGGEIEFSPTDEADREDGLLAAMNPNADRGADTGDNDSNHGATSQAAEIIMAFDGPCWVDVRDASGEFKLFGEMNKGDRKVLGGRAPYSIILGNATAVELTIDGKPVDIEARARGNVARFDLDPSVL